MDNLPFETDVTRTFVEPIVLDDGTLMGLDRATMHTLVSSDRGRTWREGWPLKDGRGRPIIGDGFTRAYIVNFLRLRSGDIGLKFEVQQRGANRNIGTRLDAYFCRSSDEGRTWSEPVRITPPTAPTNSTWLIESSDGRLVLPNEYEFTQPHGCGRAPIGVCNAFYSTDGGRTWRESRDGLWVYEQDGAMQGGCEVPVVAETADAALIMFMRTKFQRIAQSTSDDGGGTWSHVELNGLVSGNSEIFLVRIPSTGDLLCIWNQASTQEIETGFYRARLTSAISSDGGRRWGSFCTVAMSPGQEGVGRVADTDSPRFLETPMPVPIEENMVADEFHMNRAPRVQFIGDLAFLVYTHRVYRYRDGARDRVHDRMKLRVVPVEWFYGGEE